MCGFDVGAVKCVAFDLFGTVFDLSDTPKHEIRAYIAHVRKPEWSPLVLPESWLDLKPFPDAVEGIRSILEAGYYTFSCSNAPYEFTETLMERCGLDPWFVGYTDIAVARCYKPDPRSYLELCDQYRFQPQECLMVTGNAGSPDIDGAKAVGMQSIMIRQPGCVPTIAALAELLGQCVAGDEASQ
jgi:HAD superfamily hydrolase (TIGR01493 family)